MKYFLIFISIAFIKIQDSGINAQTSELSGQFKDHEGNAISYAYVALFNHADSNLVKVEPTNESGSFQFINLQAGNYFLKSSYAGLKEYRRDNIQVQSSSKLDLGVLTLTPSQVLLQEATVIAKRALMEVKADRTIFNVEGTINSIGSDAISLLRKAPGITVDNNDNINLLGRAGVLVYIDGKKLPLSGDDLSNYLQNLQAEQIDRIEIISNPGAKYEAEGNAGIIDIRLKRDKNLGMNGSINANFSQGRYPRANLNASGNYRNKLCNVFGTAGIGHWRGFNRMEFESYQNDLYLEEINLNRNKRNNFNHRLGLDYFLSKNQTIGLLWSSNTTNGKSLGENRIDLASEATPQIIDSVLNATTDALSPRTSQTYNLNYRFDDKKNRNFNVDIDYGFFNNENDRDQDNIYFDKSEQIILSQIVNHFDTRSDIDIATLKMDYEQEAFDGKIGVGIKFSRVTSDNSYLVFDIHNGLSTMDDSLSNQFNYVENVYAAYMNYNKSIQKNIHFNAGLRLEQTDARGDLLTFRPELQEPPVVLNYLSWFPSAGISWQLKPGKNLSLNYGRRINRPDYNVLNPFNNQLSQLSFEKGNPFLKPEIVNNVELGYSFAYKYNFKLGYSLTEDQITRLIGPDDKDPRASFISWDNLAKQTIWSFNASLPVEIMKHWNSYFNISGSHIDNQARYENGGVVDLQAFTYSIFQQHSFEIPWGLRAEISGYYSGPGIWGGVFVYESSWSLDLGLQRKFLQNHLNVKVSAADIFYESGWEGVSEFNGLKSFGRGNWDSRRLNVSISYVFGNENVKSRKRNLGLEDEEQRVKGE